MAFLSSRYCINALLPPLKMKTNYHTNNIFRLIYQTIL